MIAGRRPSLSTQSKGEIKTYVRMREEMAFKPSEDLKLDDCPDWFDDERKQEWEALLKEFPAGTVKKIDRDAFIGVIDSAVTYRRVARLALTTPTIFTDADGIPRRHPIVAIVRDAHMLMLRTHAEFGLTPSSRYRVQTNKIDPVKKEASDEFDALMRDAPEDRTSAN